ncbi:diaminobutyrate--2-oxoglutarate transaminase [Streptomyces sp. NPDC002812]|uniref:diaminobutyrate--2-oxoglutarate transaminase n=1 Tax=Streptomyces sp. NPDC002812 TaxID=3154434 RepID=UPI00331B0266
MIPVDPTIESIESSVRSYSRKFPVVFTTGKGPLMLDEDGREYLDFFCGSGALNYGHNPASQKQALLDYIEADGLTHGLDLFTDAKRTFLHRFRQVVLDPRGLSHRVQSCGPTGTNAVEAALKLARKATGRRTVVSFHGGFHGVSEGSLSVTGNRALRQSSGTGPHATVFLPYPDGPAGSFDSLDLLERMIDDPYSGSEIPAAVIVETVQSDGGIYCAPAGWLRKLRELTARHGIVLICDDIFAGCGRTGDFFSFEEAGITPDLITLSKSISGYGLPLSLLLISPELDVWEPGEHSGTFRGNQLAFVTAAAALDHWTDPGFLAHLRVVQERLAAFADTVYLQTGLVVRGRGLVLGVDTGDAAYAERIQRRCLEDGLVIERCGREDEVMRVLPALTIGTEDLDRGLDLLLRSLHEEARHAVHAD